METPLNARSHVCFEVEKVIGISSDGTYQVQWAPAWVSKLHLVGCEHLIEEFLQKQSEGVKTGPESQCAAEELGAAEEVAEEVAKETTDEFLKLQMRALQDAPDLISNDCENVHQETNAMPSEEEVGVQHDNEMIQLQNVPDGLEATSLNDEGLLGPESCELSPESLDMGLCAKPENGNEPADLVLSNPLPDEPDFSLADMKMETAVTMETTVNNLLNPEHSVLPDPSTTSALTFMMNNHVTMETTVDVTHPWNSSNTHAVSDASLLETMELVDPDDADWATEDDLRELGFIFRDENDSNRYRCKICKFKTTNRDVAEEHHLLHQNRPHQCDTCGKLFTRRHDLKRHFTIHTGIKPFECPGCKRTIRMKGNLKKHMQTCRLVTP